ncbi:MAG: hypothetical protein KC445_14310 [Anaerolineales bacterium]|nr:hypothetical protein [Anaerolineales bacterium]
MLFFIGGAARTGKGILSRRLLAEMQLPYLSLDVLKMGLARGAPQFKIDPDAGAIQVAEHLWPLIREMSISLIHDQVDYVFEGELLPKDVNTFRQAYPSQICACFLGYATVSPAQKLAEIRLHGGHPNDWSQEYADAELLNIIKREIDFSQYVQAECVKHHIRYFDSSNHFMDVLDSVFRFIKGERLLKKVG